MRRIPFVLLVLFFLFAIYYMNSTKDFESRSEEGLYPPIEPFHTGMLRVSGIHELYYEQSGNPDGIPVIGLHGGPGGSSSPEMRRYFDPKKFHIILFDQRGAGRSRPRNELTDNNTQALVRDIETLRDTLNLDRIVLFGGSWGSTLALVYAETYPERISGLVLRGVFTATREEIDHFYHGGIRSWFPSVYDKLREAVPPEASIPAFLYDKLAHGNPFEKSRYSRLWCEYEFKLAELVVPRETLKALDHEDKDLLYTFALIENYYMANGCFLEPDQIWRNLDRLKDIPVYIVNGRYDMICPPVTAYRLYNALPNGALIIAEGAGHWMGEPPVRKGLLESIRTLGKQISRN